MENALPNVCPNDDILDACRHIGCQFVESLFYRIALEHGFGKQAENKARELFLFWGRNGYKQLPDWVRASVLRINNGELPA